MSQEPYLSPAPVLVRRVFVLLFVVGFLASIWFVATDTTSYGGWVLLVVTGAGIAMTLRQRHLMTEGHVVHRRGLRERDRG